MSEREQDTRVTYAHKHVYIYEFEIENHKSWGGKRWTTMQYTLCTDVTGPMAKENRKLLEAMLRIVYGHYPKGVKFVREKL